MIPLQLKIRNFLSYGSQSEPIDFEPHHLICLTGKNGHGKSALLDAITWALWGQARKIAGITRSDEHLIRLGESGMAVTLDFSCNNQRYRVTRDFSISLNKKGIMQLHLGLFKDEIQAYVSLSEKNIRDTQEKLDAIVGIDYDTFINSVFLRQGQANEFSKKSPLERKEILSSLLGLSRYEELRKRALEYLRNYQKEQEVITHVAKSMTEELNSKQDAINQTKNIEKQIADLAQTQQLYSSEIEAINLKQQEAINAKMALALALQSLEQQSILYAQKRDNLILFLRERRAFQRLKKELNASTLTLAYEKTIGKINSYESQKKYLITCKEQLVKISAERQQRHGILQTELQAELQTITEKVHHSQLAHERIETRLSELYKKSEKLTSQINELITKKTILTEKISPQETTSIQLDLLTKKITRASHFAGCWQLKKQYYTEMIDVAKLRMQKLTVHDSVCPLCTQALPDEQRKELINQAKRSAHVNLHRHKRLEKYLANLTAKTENYKHAQQKLFFEKEQFTTYAYQLTQVNEQLAAYEHEKIEITTDIASVVILSTSSMAELTTLLTLREKKQNALLTFQTFDKQLIAYDLEIKNLIEQIKSIEKELNSINEEELRNELNRINEQKNAISLINHEELLNKKRRKDISAIIQELRTNGTEQKSLLVKISNLRRLAEKLPEYEKSLQNIGKERTIIQQRQHALYEQRGALTRQLAVLEKREQELENHHRKIKELEKTIGDYQLLAQALSKNGIQALIIEQAVPELEAETNTLLARLTDNQAQIMIESLRDLKSGGSKETLDIKISDAMGIRPYELFSGGEAFRIDFALRIALSKLLARRSGTSLQTLIIDEGFGSQDEEGLTLIQESLHSIQEDFEKIIVVSHLPSMKHQFPTNFVIQKCAEGSTVTVVQQG